VAPGEWDASPEFVQQLNQLFAAYQDRVYGACFYFMRDPDRAGDMAQETLLIAWRKLPTFRGESSFHTWLCGIARGQCFNAIRRKKDLLSGDGVVEPASEEATVLARLRRQERENLIRAASMAVLDAGEQEAVHLRYVEQVSQDRITDLLDLTEASGARGVLQRCRRKLQRELRRRLQEMGHGTSFIREST